MIIYALKIIDAQKIRVMEPNITTVGVYINNKLWVHYLLRKYGILKMDFYCRLCDMACGREDFYWNHLRGTLHREAVAAKRQCKLIGGNQHQLVTVAASNPPQRQGALYRMPFKWGVTTDTPVVITTQTHFGRVC